jgi:enterochelin esterase-like enzyme
MIMALALALAVSAPDTVPTGRLQSFNVSGRPFADSLTVQVYLPPGYSASRRLPAIYAFHPHADYFGTLKLPAALDSAIAADMAPTLAVLLPAVEDQKATRPGTPEFEAWQQLVMERVIPAVEARYAARRDAAGRRLLAFSIGANVLTDLAVRHPGRFSRVAAQSPGWMFWDEEKSAISDVHIDEAIGRVERARGAMPAFWFMWGDAAEEWESRSRVHGERYLAALRGKGAAVEGPVLVPGGHGLRLVTSSLPAALRFLAYETK